MSAGNQLVFIPFPVMSHLVSSVETAKLLVQRDPLLSITVLVFKLPTDTKIDDSIKNSVESRINFIEISENPGLVSEHAESPGMFAIRFINGQKDRVRALITELMAEKRIRVAGLVIDMFCTAMIDVANKLGIPTFVFFASGAAVLGLFFHIQILGEDDQDEDYLEKLMADGDAELSIPAYVHPVPSRVLPSLILNRDMFRNLVKRFRETNGILINTFLELESHAISSLTGDEKVPPVYPIGPILQLPHGEESDKNRGKRDEIVEWLSGQPDSSVVFLCFGSVGCFEKDQVKEIAAALERSGHIFLWSLRKPPTKGKMEFPGDYEDPEEVLPVGFIERTAGIGKVIGWAPQMAILRHPATGGFVSHCGWNSTLESIWCGVPMAVWPLAAEQQVNAFLLVKEFGMAVEIQMDYRKDSGVVVEAEKIEKAIRQLMDPEDEIRAKVKVMKNKSKMALVEGGSSYHGLCRFLEDIKQS